MTQTVYIRSAVFEEKNSKDASAKALAEKDRTVRAQLVVHLTDGTSRTIEYHTFDGAANPGTIKITQSSFKFVLTVTALQFEVNKPGAGYEWAKFEKWVLSKSGFQNTPLVDGSHDQDDFVKACVAHLEATGTRPDFSEKVSSIIKLSLHAPSAEEVQMFNMIKNNIARKIRDLKKTDEEHSTNVADRLPSTLTTYTVVEAAVHQVEYGFQHFAKIHVGGDVYVHARLHEFSDGNIEYHSIDTTRDTAAWSKDTALVYFDF
ncbi:hypothetical protein BC831DRAFT_465956 [Entophlyctis helioformis]|nr:hypothetical protein BC831DRAFT_465956 [Entophlyctis helioformis]